MKLAWLLVALPAFAFAQDENLVGAGLRAKPAYDGSKTEHMDAVPILSYYRGPLFARTTQGVLEGGARAEIAHGLHVGGQLAYEEGRDSPRLNPSASIGAHAEYDTKLGPAPLNLLVRLRRDVNAGRGSQLDLRATMGVYESGPLAAAVYAQETWASRRAMGTYYGQPDGGALFAALGVYAGYDLSREWELVGNVEARRLQGEAASSPLSQRRGAYYAVVGIAYRFQAEKR